MSPYAITFLIPLNAEAHHNAFMVMLERINVDSNLKAKMIFVQLRILA